MDKTVSLRSGIRGHNRNVAYRAPVASPEKKNIDSTIVLPPVATATGVLTLLNGSVAGALPTNRIGRRVHMHSLTIKGTIQLASTTTGNCPLRLIIFYDKQSNKLAPGVVDLMQTDSIASLNLLANSHRFRVIRDIIIPCVGTAGPQAAYINEYTKLAGLETEYIDGAGAGTVADITSGSLYCLMYANNATAVAALLNAVNARVRYSDA